ncbi:MAG: hypothetical protein R3185_00090 [Candidatus Thermoplasmatota archaeon]|nr:hypothetical protein [Candidatus Thermoplasmatota archaeon]
MAPTHESFKERMVHKVEELEHSSTMWFFAGMTTLLLFMLASIEAAVSGEPSVFFFTMWVVAIVMAVFVIPGWALIYLEGSDEDPELDEGLWKD